LVPGAARRTLGKSGQAIGVPLNDAAVAVLRRCIGKHDRFIFTYNGTPILNVNCIAWRRGLRRVEIANFRWHDLRDTWASHHAMNGTPIHVIQELDGWHDMQMVKRYAHMSVESLSRYAGNAALASVQGPVAANVRGCG
jgi:integrase